MKGRLGGRLVYKTEQHKTDNGGFDSQVISVMAECTAGYKVGDKFQLGCWDSGGQGS